MYSPVPFGGFRRRPRGASHVNWSDSLAAKLMHAFLLNEHTAAGGSSLPGVRDVGSRPASPFYMGNFSGNYGWKTAPNGETCVGFDGGVGGGDIEAPGPCGHENGNLTVFQYLYQRTGASSYRGLGELSGSGVDSLGWHFDNAGNGHMSFLLDAVAVLDSGILTASNTPYTAAWVYTRGVQCYFELMNQASHRLSVATVASASAPSQGVRGHSQIGGIQLNAGEIFDGWVMATYIWAGRLLTSPELRRLHDDPYCLLRSDPSLPWYVPGTSGGGGGGGGSGSMFYNSQIF